MNNLPKGIGSFNSFNLHRDMELVASDDEEQIMEEVDQETEEMQTLPEHIVKRFKTDKAAKLSLDQVTKSLSMLDGKLETSGNSQ